MLNIFREYLKIIGYALTGIAFGFGFFYLFLNLNHYQEVRRNVYIDFANDNSINKLNETLDKVEANINKLDVSNYMGTIPISQASVWQRKLRSCVNNFNSSTFKEIQSKKEINIQDVYNLRNEYESEILNDCLVYDMYSLILNGGPNSEVLKNNEKLIEYYIDDLLAETTYLEKDLNNNSSYFFNSEDAILSLKNPVHDGFYEVLSSYNRAANFLEIMSDLFVVEIGGVQ